MEKNNTVKQLQEELKTTRALNTNLTNQLDKKEAEAAYRKNHNFVQLYRDQLLHLAKLYSVVEIKSYARSAKKLTTSQLELLLIKNRIKLPINRSSDKAIAKQELKENSTRNIYLSICFIIFLGCLIATRPYIKNVVNEVKFTYVAEEYSEPKVKKSKKTKKKK